MVPIHDKNKQNYFISTLRFEPINIDKYNEYLKYPHFRSNRFLNVFKIIRRTHFESNIYIIYA